MPLDRGEELRRRLLATFREEADEHLAVISAELERLRGAEAPGPAELELLFRTVHTLKGAARSVGLAEIEAHCQSSESALRQVIDGRGSFADKAGLIRDGHDAVARLMARDHGAAAAKPAAPRPPEPPRPASPSIRVDIGRLDRLSVLAEELLLPKLAAAQRAEEARALDRKLARFAPDLAGADGQAVAELKLELRALARSLTSDARRLRSAVDELSVELRATRMLPAETMLGGFPLMVRDLAGATGKLVDWRVTGAEVPVDRLVLELVKDPLIHLLRNAIDHGIETPAERRLAGKRQEGSIALAFTRLDASRIGIEIADDGRGLDAEKLAGAARRARLLGEEASADPAQLALLPGVSTSPEIGAISGHGMGLAIVRERVERIEGRLTIDTAPGRGTTIRLELPASIATYRGLLVRAGSIVVLWPGEAVDRAIGIPAGSIAETLQRGMLVHEGETLPLGRLSAILGGGAAVAPADRPALEPALVVHSGGRRAVLLVDEILGEREILVKEFRPPLRRVRNILSAGLLGTGDLVLVARPSDVLEAIGEPAAAAPEPVAARAARARRILVVDDSLTTRTMERNLLEAAGYVVRTAADGIDALGVLQDEEIDLVLSDVDMPNLDGFELTSRIRADQVLSRLPVVLVTALETRQDKERGLKAGANAYVLKSAFNQSNLLEIVGRLA